MTGFGKSAGTVKRRKIVVEIRSVNSKGLDMNFRLPAMFRDKEPEIRNFLSQKLKRGKIDFAITFDSLLDEKFVSLNKTMVRKHHSELKALCRELKMDDEEILLAILRMPDIFIPEKVEFTLRDWKVVFGCIEKAALALDKFRISEGKLLEKDLRKRINLILKYLSAVERMDEGRVASVKERLRFNLKEIVPNRKVDENRLEQELIYYVEKLDITEEKVRLKTHCDYFLKTMNENECGRKLGFISQEIGREINTIGSKANDAQMQKMVVRMKDELEKIKEQLNNVL
jgi:uncharacterized protein (TIGR00255 family)